MPATSRTLPSLARRSVIALVGMAALPAIATAANAQHVLYKCIDKAGVVSIQSSACPAGATTSWRRDATPEAPLTPAQAVQAEAKRLRDQQSVRDLSAQLERRLNQEQEAKLAAPADEALPPPLPAATPTPNPDLQACQDAQEFANQVRGKDWLGLSEEHVRRLYAWVAQPCKVPSGRNASPRARHGRGHGRSR